MSAHALLDHVISVMRLKNDAALARMLEVAPPVISKVRHYRLPVGSTLILSIHEATGLSIREIKALIPMEGP